MRINGYFMAEDGHLYSEQELAQMDERPQEIKVFWVNAYSVSSEYGGPEEGGWWYDWYKCIASMPVQNNDHSERHIGTIEQLMKNALGWEPTPYEQNHGGSRYTANGHSDFLIRIEGKRMQSETTERRFYE
jgi:hypothetical protein